MTDLEFSILENVNAAGWQKVLRLMSEKAYRLATCDTLPIADRAKLLGFSNDLNKLADRGRTLPARA